MGAFSRGGETQSFEEKEPQEHTRGKMACCPIFLYFNFYFDLTFQLTVIGSGLISYLVLGALMFMTVFKHILLLS